MEVLTVSDLELRRESRVVLNGVQVSVQRGDFVALMGPSGSGKTTVLRAVAGLEAFERGRIDVDGVARSPPAHRARRAAADAGARRPDAGRRDARRRIHASVLHARLADGRRHRRLTLARTSLGPPSLRAPPSLPGTSVPTSDLRPRPAPPSLPRTSVPPRDLRPAQAPPSLPGTSVPSGECKIFIELRTGIYDVGPVRRQHDRTVLQDTTTPAETF